MRADSCPKRRSWSRAVRGACHDVIQHWPRLLRSKTVDVNAAADLVADDWLDLRPAVRIGDSQGSFTGVDYGGPLTVVRGVLALTHGSSLNGVGKAVFWVGLGSDRLGSSLL